MKKAAFLAALAFLISATAAHGGTHEGLPEPGSAPGDFFYGFDKAKESISLALTFNQQRKAEKKLEFARERLAEAKKLSDQNSSNAAQAMKNYQSQIKDVESEISELPGNQSEMRQKMEETRGQAVNVLAELKKRLPEQAMKGINTALNATKGHGKPPAPPTMGEKKPESSGNATGDVQSGSGGYVATGRVIKND